jgi:hypothetical protein
MFNVLCTVVGGYVGRLYDDSVNFIFPETGPIYENGYQIFFKGDLSFRANCAEELTRALEAVLIATKMTKRYPI